MSAISRQMIQMQKLFIDWNYDFYKGVIYKEKTPTKYYRIVSWTIRFHRKRRKSHLKQHTEKYILIKKLRFPLREKNSCYEIYTMSLTSCSEISAGDVLWCTAFSTQCGSFFSCMYAIDTIYWWGTGTLAGAQTCMARLRSLAFLHRLSEPIFLKF